MTAALELLWIDDVVPERRLGSGFPRALSLLRLLASSGFQVTLFPFKGGRAEGAAVADLNRSGVQVVQYAGRPQDVLADFCKAELARFDAVWISRWRNFRAAQPIIRAHPARPRLIYDAEALASVREIARREVMGTPFDDEERRSLLADEFGMMRGADAIVSVSQPEREAIRRACAKPTFLLGHLETAAPTPRGFAERADLLFVGRFHQEHCPNTDSVAYFAHDVLPLIRRQVDCRLNVFGFRSEILRLDDPAVVVHGAVEHLDDAYDRARVMVVPTRYAAGVPGKLAEAFARGLPCVATPIIAAQVPFREPPVLCGSSAAEFASRVVDLYTDPVLWRRTREIGEEFARTYYSEEAMRAQVDALRSWIA
jgi:glycosyltransferase involved in cell wall biosynthesis